MRVLFSTVDQLLRGGFTAPETLRAGSVPLATGQSLRAALLLGAIYGLFMGLYGGLRASHASVGPIGADIVKVPLLFLLTLAVTAPSLYVVSALAGSPLRVIEMTRLLLAAIVVNLALLASFGPVTAFFTLSTESYPFMVLLNVAFFAVSGFVGVAFLRRAVHAMFASAESAGERVSNDVASSGVAARPVRHAGAGWAPERRIFTAWTVIYAAVGAQMGWILRPFIGTPAEPFTLFRVRESNFFEAVLHAFRQLFS